MSATITIETTLTTVSCCVCGTLFGIHTTLYNKLYENGRIFYCPNGHDQHFSEPLRKKYEKLKKELADERQDRIWWQEEAELKAAEVEDKTNQLRGNKAALTKLKKRVAGGVCPCCHRQFVNLRRHMETKHPDYVSEDES